MIPSPLHSYTGGASEVEGSGSTIGALVDDLDTRHPGIKFRMIDEHDRVRPHVRFYVGDEMVKKVDHSLEGVEVIQIVCAISGG